MIKLVYWADFACPYCYIGRTRLKKAINELGIKDKMNIEFKSFQLDPHAAQHTTETTLDRLAKKYNLSKEDAAAKIDEISSMGRAEGIDFKYATTRSTNTFNAHRLAKFALEKGGYELQDKVSDLLFNAYFTKNLELADAETLLGVAEEAGMDRKEVEEMLKSDKYKMDVTKDESDAMLYGVQGVPFFIFNEKFAVPGAFTKDAFKRTLEKLMKESIKVIDDDDTLGHCGTNGCTFPLKGMKKKD